ncbi:MAG: 2-oxoacid:acceptor oxidoreductase family protein [Deltaproteobacteria bacterium]|nr:2-oxoacid:acceptor oxidoreductase family protein [Deltaproteobacteria bacterium]
MSEISIRFAGFGGQGIVLAAVTAAHAAIIYEGKVAIQTQSYGPESRGGSSKAEVIISDEEINYPLIDAPDILIALSQEAIEKYYPATHDDSIIVIDPAYIKAADKYNARKRYEIPAARLADGLGSRQISNMVILGALIRLTHIISESALVKSIQDNTGKAFHASNLKGMKAGARYVEMNYHGDIKGKDDDAN